jgi:hypothetical protein
LDYLPTKKFILIGLSLLIIGGGFLIFSKTQKIKISEKLPIHGNGNNPIIAEEIAKDSDNDGLKDWEEALWETNPNNPDTDGDKTPDGQEIKEGRNPLVPGPNDKLPKFKPENTKSSSEIPLPSSLTDALSRELFTQYWLAKQQSGGEISKEDATQIARSFADSIQNFGEVNKVENYLKSDIKIADNDRVETIKDYGNNLGFIIRKYFDPLPESEIFIFKRAAENEDKAELKKLEPLASAYRQTVKEMLSLETPPSFSDSHLELINHFNIIAQEIDMMQKLIEDPSQALLAVQQYQKEAEATQKILGDINTYFSENGIVFGLNDPAQVFRTYMR